MKPESIFCLMLSLDLVLAQNNDGDEGSGDVCNVDGSTCPNDKCCRQSKCTTEAPELKCCDDPSKDPDRSNPECSNCPLCSKCYALCVYIGVCVRGIIRKIVKKYVST